MKKNKGFTLIELLAVIVLLGLLVTLAVPSISRILDKSNTESLDSQKEMLIIAAKSYTENNSAYLPKTVGATVKIEASFLKENNYLNSDIKNSKKNCTNQSYVEIYKNERLGYEYTAYIICDWNINWFLV